MGSFSRICKVHKWQLCYVRLVDCMDEARNRYLKKNNIAVDEIKLSAVDYQCSSKYASPVSQPVEENCMISCVKR